VSASSHACALAFIAAWLLLSKKSAIEVVRAIFRR